MPVAETPRCTYDRTHCTTVRNYKSILKEGKRVWLLLKDLYSSAMVRKRNYKMENLEASEIVKLGTRVCYT